MTSKVDFEKEYVFQFFFSFLAINPSFLSPVVKDKSGDDTYDYLILIVGIQSYSTQEQK